MSIFRLLELDQDQKYKEKVNDFIDHLILDFSKVKKNSADIIANKRNTYTQQVDKYITENKVELINGLWKLKKLLFI